MRQASGEVSDRSFGLLMAAILLVIGFVRSNLWAVAGAALLLSLALSIPSVLRGPKRAWLLLGRGMGAIVNPIILGFLFYLVITPAGCWDACWSRPAPPPP
jgi:uncharacterized membrane protein